jgi:hypothetical protein
MSSNFDIRRENRHIPEHRHFDKNKTYSYLLIPGMKAMFKASSEIPPTRSFTGHAY